MQQTIYTSRVLFTLCISQTLLLYVYPSAHYSDIPGPGGTGLIKDEDGGTIVPMDKGEVLHVDDWVIERKQVNRGTGQNVLALPVQ